MDKLFTWNGIPGTYNQVATAPAAFNLAEINLQLMCQNTVESGTHFPQRYHWSGVADRTDWSSFESGQTDILNNLGPGQGIIKLGQYGYGYHVNGIIQIIPTGQGQQPFTFTPIVNCSLGNIIPRSLDHFNRDGIEQSVHVALDNVYIFNQSSLIPIGDQPLDAP